MIIMIITIITTNRKNRRGWEKRQVNPLWGHHQVQHKNGLIRPKNLHIQKTAANLKSKIKPWFQLNLLTNKQCHLTLSTE